TASLGNNGPTPEGSATSIDFTNQLDPSTADTNAGFHYAYSCSNGDLSGATYAGSGTSASTSCTFDDGPSTHTVKARIIDKDGGFSQYQTVVSVTNVDPTASAPSPQSSNEGENHSFNLGSFSDPGSDSPWAVSVDWGDGSALTTYQITGTGAAVNVAIGPKSHTYADGPNDFTVHVTVTDKDLGSDTKTFAVHVNNVAPTVTYTSAPATADEGQTKTYNYSVSDPGVLDTFSVDDGYPTCGDFG